MYTYIKQFMNYVCISYLFKYYQAVNTPPKQKSRELTSFDLDILKFCHYDGISLKVNCKLFPGL
jgi:hypothetical protein